RTRSLRARRGRQVEQADRGRTRHRRTHGQIAARPDAGEARSGIHRGVGPARRTAGATADALGKRTRDPERIPFRATHRHFAPSVRFTTRTDYRPTRQGGTHGPTYLCFRWRADDVAEI